MTQTDRQDAHAPGADECGVVELRRYTLRPGRRDTLITLFEREFIEPQKAVGMRLVGQFCDLDAPGRFVWLRGFADMGSRPHGLQAFYGGPAWAAHREAANATLRSRGRAGPAADRASAGVVSLMRSALHA